jgi:hypothetical protein
MQVVADCLGEDVEHLASVGHGVEG